MRLVQLVALLILVGTAYGAVLGVDLGANSFKAAVIRGGGIDVLLNDVSKRKTPTALAFHPEEGVFYGDAALTYSLRAPDRSVTSIGLHLGRQGPHLAPLQASARGSPELRLTQEGDIIPAEALASLLLSKVRAAGGNVRDVAISVPAWFGHSQRRALLDAAELAGLSVLSLVNDGTALALAYATLRDSKPVTVNDQESEPEHVLIIDIGAWSSRATLLSVKFSVVEGAKGKTRTVPHVSVLQHAWEESAGGDAIDALLAEHLRKQVPFKEIPQRAHVKLLREAKRVKEVLSANTNTVAQIEGLVDDWNLRVTVTRKELEALLEPLLPRMIAPVQRVLSASNVSVSALVAVELVGGGGRVPAVQSALSAALAGRALDKHLNGDEALVEGTALYAASLSSGLRVREVRLRDGSQYAYHALLSLNPEADGEVAPTTNGGYRVELFKKGAKLGGRRTLKVTAAEVFSVDIIYADPTALPRGVGAQVATYSISGFEALQGLGPARIVLQFRLTTSGLVELERVHAEVMETVTDAPAAEKEKEAEKKEGEQAKEEKREAEADKKDDEAGERSSEDAKNAAAASGDKKQRVKHVVMQSSVTVPAVQMSAADRKEAEAVLARLKARDETRKKREAAKNALEAELYALRERLEESTTQACSTEAERTALSTAIAEQSVWLEDTTVITPTADYTTREKDLKALFAPIAKRIVEEESRPRAVAAARTVLSPIPKLIGNISATLNVTEEEITAAVAEVTDTLKWLDEITALQEKKARNEDGAFLADEVAERARRIEKRARRLLSRPTRLPPPPPPSTTPPPATSTENPTPEQQQQQETREQDAIKEEKERVPEN